MDKMARIMELFWLVLAIISAVLVGYMIATHGWDASKVFTWFPLVCVAMWLYRRFTRKKMREWAERQPKEPGTDR